MLIVTGAGPLGPLARKPAKPTTEVTAFHLPEAEAATETAAPDPTSPTARPPPSDHAAIRDRAARQHGKNLLDSLANLQRSLLAETDTDAQLDHLASLAQTLPDAASPDLRTTVRAIAARAAVELARRDCARLAANSPTGTAKNA